MATKLQQIRKILDASLHLQQRIAADAELLAVIAEICAEIINAFRHDKKVLLCGNGGSAADAQHLATELSGKFYLDRTPLFAEALHVNTSYLTAVANDYSFAHVYSRLVKAKGRPGDVLIAISTSGNSANVVDALKMAASIGMVTVGLTGGDGGKIKELCRYLVQIPSADTPKIQEAHIIIGHIICQLVEKDLFAVEKQETTDD